MRSTTRNIILSQLILYAGLIVCVIIRPAGLGANDGISYYGIHGDTIIPYAIGLLGAAYFTMRVVRQLEPDKYPVIRTALKIYAPLIVGIVVTPYAAGRWMDYLHTACGSVLFFLQLVLSGYFIWRLHYNWWSITLSLIELAGGILSLIYLNPTHGFLFQTQVLFQLAFGALLILSLQRLARSQQ